MRRVKELKSDGAKSRCLTEFSVVNLIIGALLFSAMLWSAIFAVL